MNATTPGPSIRKLWRTPALLALVGAMSTLTACEDGTGPEDRPSFITDATNDFLASFAGPRNADLDVRRGEVSYDGTNFVFTSTSAGRIGSTPGALFVWGVNRGAGTARFGALAPGVLFDAVVIIQPDGTSRVVDLSTNPPTQTALPTGSATFSGNGLTVTVPANLLPSRGFDPSGYTVNLWPRTGAGNNNQISDFAPDNHNVPVRVRR
jgi:hypothetical protein